MTKVLQLPSRACGYLIAPPLTLLILFVKRASEMGRTTRQQQKEYVHCTKYTPQCGSSP